MRIVPLGIVLEDTDELGVEAGFVPHEEDAEDPDPHDAAGKGRVCHQDEDIERVSVLGERVGHEAVVGRIGRRREQAPVQSDDVVLVVVLVLVPAAGGDLDHHIDSRAEVSVMRDPGSGKP
jgi:hypothetical protein